ncbi:uncharacterized protein LOC119349956 [Triticum dicoccoides]|uniref:uncharacterized protein LOC119349956 n=1 Tax=Triticum dicoccoides TaxID=85692 RepID=UPI00188E4ED2|nr:uncharacterized protein LOC119349956 [Triticum dicoccoides]
MDFSGVFDSWPLFLDLASGTHMPIRSFLLMVSGADAAAVVPRTDDGTELLYATVEPLKGSTQSCRGTTPKDTARPARSAGAAILPSSSTTARRPSVYGGADYRYQQYQRGGSSDSDEPSFFLSPSPCASSKLKMTELHTYKNFLMHCYFSRWFRV